MADRTLTGISLTDVRKLVDEKNIGDDVADTVGKLLGLVIAVAPVAGGPGLLPLWALIEPKNELIEAIRFAARKFSKSKPSDYLDRAERMAAANCLLVYAAYFDALRHEWPAIVRDLGISEEEAKKAWTATAEQVTEAPAASRAVADHVIALPRPADQLALDSETRRDVFAHLSMVVESYVWEILSRPRDTTGLASLGRHTDVLPQRAEELYQAEYLGLAVEFEQFFVWGVLQDRAARAGQIQQLAGDQRTWFELLGRAMHSLDLGLRELAEAVARLPASTFTGSVRPDVREAAEGLHRTYADVLDRQVIDDQFTVDDADVPRLSFPRKIDGFVPQAYRVAVYHAKDMHLERDDAWQEHEAQADIGAFLLRYLESPYSVQTPLLILGHPGSGKSLLTEVLAGRLAYPAYTTLRVKLRDVDPDVSLLTQLESQIRNDTGGRSVTWADFAEELSANPPVVILDGYDELLQATGKVFASYLDEVRQFQHQQAVQNRPVRVIVTSRLTLIDKAAIPLGTTVVKLEDFDTERRQAWCDVWNRHNGPYFERARIRPFAVPDNEKLLELARQPLLLLMLAIYDSLGNELSSRPDIDQTLLYDSLLRRFIQRELSKGTAGHEFTALPEADQAKAVHREMERLGVAAIGMFNRQDLKIQREELNDDLGYFGFDRAVTAEGRALAEADLLLGSFFFIHESRSKLQEESAGPGDGQAAFEFLHNTFGEFLAADFILRRVTEEAATICKLTGDAMLDGTRTRQLAMLDERWFGCLVHTALHTRPVILTMIREWGRHRLGNEHWSRAEMLAALDTVVVAQLRRVLNDMAIPDPDSERRARSGYAGLPMRGHLAVYSLNLVLVRAYLADENYLLAEADLGDRPDSCRPWDGLAHLWRSWFTLDSLSALADMLTAERRDKLIEITPGWSTLIPMNSGPLCDSARTAVALADNLTAAPAILHVAQLTGTSPEDFRELWRRAGSVTPELNAVAEVLAQRMFALNGDGLGAVPDGAQGSPRLLGFTWFSMEWADVASRLTHTPLQWRKIEVAPSFLLEFSALSRYEAEASVDARSKLEPSWLPDLLRTGAVPDWDMFLRSPAAAPVLRAAVREFDRRQCSAVVAPVEENLRRGIEVFDVDTASALAVLGFLGDDTGLCALALDVIMDRCEQGTWRLLDIPLETWEGLASVFRSADPVIDARRGRFVGLLESAVAESLEGEGFRDDDVRDVRTLAPFWVQALRIGAEGKKDAILAMLDGTLRRRTLTSWERKYLLALVGWARESGNDISPLLSFLDSLVGGEWLRSLVMEEDEDMVARMLTYKEAMDLRWAVGLLRQADQ
jgi:hypothetical protein